MKAQKLLLINMLLFVSLLSACTKEDENRPVNTLMDKTWKRGMIDKNPSSNPSGRITYYPVQNCEKDDSFKFNANNMLTIEKGTSKCDNNESTTETVPYSYNKSNKELIIGGARYSIAEESETQIKYYAPIPSNTGYDYIVFLLE